MIEDLEPTSAANNDRTNIAPLSGIAFLFFVSITCIDRSGIAVKVWNRGGVRFGMEAAEEPSEVLN